MSYSNVGILAILIQAIINKDVLWEKKQRETDKVQWAYRNFLLSVLFYHLSDAIWGLLYEYRLTLLLYADTTLYFFTMAGSVVLWTQYVVAYLEEKNKFGKMLKLTGRVFFGTELVALVINFFYPLMFWYDETGTYYAAAGRYLCLLVQMIMYLMTSLYTLSVTARREGASRNRHRTIGFFGMAMIALVLIQTLYPLLPLYSVGLLLGSCILHTFVVEDEKEETRKRLESLILLEEQYKQELGSAKRLAYTDQLTGTDNKHAYSEMIAEIDQQIEVGEEDAFGVGVFELNGLMEVNDTLGREAGDQCILKEYDLIRKTFKDCPVYRLDGGRFVVLLKGDAYMNRLAMFVAFEDETNKNVSENQVVISSGMAMFLPDRDRSFRDVIERAEIRMIKRKAELQENEKKTP